MTSIKRSQPAEDPRSNIWYDNQKAKMLENWDELRNKILYELKRQNKDIILMQR